MSTADLATVLAHAGLSLQPFQIRLLLQGGGAIVPGAPFPPIPLPDGGSLISRAVDTCAGPRTAVYVRP